LLATSQTPGMPGLVIRFGSVMSRIVRLRLRWRPMPMQCAVRRGASVFKMRDVSRRKGMDALQAYVHDADLFRDQAGCKRWRECGRAAPASELTVRVSLVPHSTQPWVTSTRSFDAAPLASCTGPAAAITIRCPQFGQERRRDDRCDGATSWQRMAFSRFHIRIRRRITIVSERVPPQTRPSPPSRPKSEATKGSCLPFGKP
jgi:hypothetical protein